VKPEVGEHSAELPAEMENMADAETAKEEVAAEMATFGKSCRLSGRFKGRLVGAATPHWLNFFLKPPFSMKMDYKSLCAL